MSSSFSSSSTSTKHVQNPRKSLGFMANAVKRKDSFVHLFFMTGILLLSMRSLGQKYRINDTSFLKEEHDALSERMKNIKKSLFEEASLDQTGLFATKLRLLFGDN